MKPIIATLTALLVSTAWAASEDTNTMLERLKSPASVCVVGDPCAESIGKASIVAAARAGDQVYNAACAGCHISGAAGAPKTGDAGAWASRLDKGMDTLVKHVVEGYNAMPARGLCTDCSDQELADAVAFMVDAL
jgi:cytochrome c5